jgi:tRNA threonylcarbamoyladenosine biosynthesis protein TsaB
MSNEVYILAIETTAKTCGVALSLNGVLLGEYSLYQNHLHDKMLAELTRRLLNDLTLNIENIDYIALSSGPGSFTGLRIGSAFTMGLLFGSERKFISIPTLEGFASATKDFAHSINAKKILVYLQSHKDLYFIQEFDLHLNQITNVSLIELSELLNKLNEPEIAIAGSGYDYKGENSLSGLQRLTPRFTLKRAYEKYLIQDFTDIATFEPLYYLDFEPKIKEKNG